MHTLNEIKNACLGVLDEDESDHALFGAVVDPMSVLELVTISEQLLDFIERGEASGMRREELIQHARKMMRVPHLARLNPVSDTRAYTVVLDQDLLQDWTVVQSWGGKESRRGGDKITQVPNYEAGLALVRAIVRRRERHGYKLVG